MTRVDDKKTLTRVHEKKARTTDAQAGLQHATWVWCTSCCWLSWVVEVAVMLRTDFLYVKGVY